MPLRWKTPLLLFVLAGNAPSEMQWVKYLKWSKRLNSKLNFERVLQFLEHLIRYSIIRSNAKSTVTASFGSATRNGFTTT